MGQKPISYREGTLSSCWEEGINGDKRRIILSYQGNNLSSFCSPVLVFFLLSGGFQIRFYSSWLPTSVDSEVILLSLYYFGILCEVHGTVVRSEEHTSELQSHHDLVCRLLLEKKKKKK